MHLCTLISNCFSQGLDQGSATCGTRATLGTQNLQVLHSNFVFIHKKYYWPWLAQKYGCRWHTEWFGIL